MAESISASYCCEVGLFRVKLFSKIKKTGFVPEKGSELFVSGIPYRATIHDVFKFFARVGDLFQVKLMTRSDGIHNRGFAYVTYMNKQLALNALRDLRDQLFMNSVCLGMQKSVDNCRIFIGGVPVSKSKDEIWHQLKMVYTINNIVDVITYKNYANPTHNRGFVFLEFRTHEEASHFRAKFWDKLYLFGKRLLVDWALPTVEIDDEKMAKVSLLIFKNFRHIIFHYIIR